MVETFAAFDGDAVVGTYILKPNQGGPRDHVANAALMVSGSVWGRGVRGCVCDVQEATGRRLSVGVDCFASTTSR